MADGRRCARVTAFCQGEPTKAVEFTTLPALAPPGPGQAAVRLVYAPINPSDINVLEGTYLHLPDSLPAVVGGEGAGVVTAVGEGVEGIAVGDRVFSKRGWASKTWTDAAVEDAASLTVLPPTVPLRVAAMLQSNPPTAYAMLRFTIPQPEGGWVIQNLSNSGVGIAVIQVAKRLGMRTVNIVRREGLAEQLTALGADRVLVSLCGDLPGWPHTA